MWLFAAQYNSICSKTLTVIVDSQPDICMSQTLSIKMGFRFCCMSVQQNNDITGYLTNLIKSRHMDRRSFIKLSSLAGASVAVSTGLAGCTVSTSANSQPQTNATFTHGVARAWSLLYTFHSAIQMLLRRFDELSVTCRRQYCDKLFTPPFLSHP